MDFGEQGGLGAWRERAAKRWAEGRFLKAGRCAVWLLLGLTASLARLPTGGAPFGVAAVAAAGPGLCGVSSLLGAALGYLLGGGLDWGLRCAAAAVLTYTVAFLFHGLPPCRSELFMPGAAALVTALTGFLASVSLRAGSVPLAPALFFDASLAFGASYFFRAAVAGDAPVTEAAELKRVISVMILLSCLLMAAARLELFGVLSLGRFLALLLVMAVAMKGGVLMGAAVGTLLGLAMDLTAGGALFYTAAYAFSGLLSGVFGRHGRLWFTLSFLLASALTVAGTWSAGPYLSQLYEAFAASVVFMILPGSWLCRFAALLQRADGGSGESGLRRFAAGKLRELSGVYDELYETVRESLDSPHNDENLARVFDRAADRVCVGCRDKNRCWNAEYIDTLSAMNDASRAMSEHGSLAESDLPEHFRSRCSALPGFVAAVNGELRALVYRRQLRTRLSENRSVAWSQYRDLAQVLGKLAEELGSVNGADPLAERRLLRYLRSLDVDADVSVYRDGGGRLRAVIESGRLDPLTRDEGYLEKLSSVVGVRLCRPAEPGGGSGKLTLLEAEPLAVSVGIAAMKKRGEAVNGDKGSYFKTDAGVLCVILSDGMGCGDEAAKDSARVVSILERFLRSGVEPAVAMKILNSVMLLRGGESWGCATVDLMCVDLFNGETCFYKYGAAPSYVKNGRSIRRIKGETLAAGLRAEDGLAPDVVRMRLKPGSTAVIATDGVLADDEDGWLKSLLERGGDDMRELARSTLREAERLYGALDDMTVVTVRVEERA